MNQIKNEETIKAKIQSKILNTEEREDHEDLIQ